MTFIPDNILKDLAPEGLEEFIVDIRQQWASLNPEEVVHPKILKLNERKQDEETNE
jgi:hypothetical protein